MLRLSPSYNLWQASPSAIEQPTQTLMPEQTSEWEAFGPKAETHFLTQGYSTPTREAIGPNPSSRFFRRWREREKKWIRRKDKWNWAWLIHTSSFLGMWSSGGMAWQGGLSCSEEIGWRPSHKKKRKLQSGGRLDEMQSGLFIGKISHTLCSWFSFHPASLQWTLIQAETRFKCK